ncbi:MAG: hypothetical protein WC824_13360 [Bacteroidota bacterium]|jgi:hypothetical protein
MDDQQMPEVTPMDTPPEAVGEQSQPVDPNVVGKLDQQEMNSLQSLQQQSLNLQTQIGGLEIRKAMMLGSMQQLKDQGQMILDRAAQRFGIKQGEQWSVNPDGTVRRNPVPEVPKQG